MSKSPFGHQKQCFGMSFRIKYCGNDHCDDTDGGNYHHVDNDGKFDEDGDEDNQKTWR